MEAGRNPVEVINKPVEIPVVEPRHHEADVEQVTQQEEFFAVEQPYSVDMFTEVGIPDTHQVQKQIFRPEVQLFDRPVDVSFTEYRDRIFEVPEIEYRERVKWVPIIEVHYVDKHVPVTKVVCVEKIVEVPQIVYEERIIEVPQVEVRERIIQVPKPIVQYVDVEVPKHVMQYYEKVVDVPSVLHKETPVEVPEVRSVDAIRQVPFPQYEQVNKEMPVYQLEAREQVIEVPTLINREVAVEVPHVQVVNCMRQELRPVIQYEDNAVPKFETRAVEKVVEVPMEPLLHEVRVDVPQVQVVEAVREIVEAVVRHEYKEVPRYEMEYREKVVQVESRLAQDRYAEQRPLRTNGAWSQTLSRTAHPTKQVTEPRAADTQHGWFSTPTSDTLANAVASVTGLSACGNPPQVGSTGSAVDSHLASGNVSAACDAADPPPTAAFGYGALLSTTYGSSGDYTAGTSHAFRHEGNTISGLST